MSILSLFALFWISICSSKHISRSHNHDDSRKVSLYTFWSSYRKEIDHLSPAYCKSISTALWGNYTYNLISKFTEENAAEMRAAFKEAKYSGKFSKVFGFPPALEFIHKKSVVLFTDATDVIYQRKSEELSHVYTQFVNSRKDNATVIFSAEANCWPMEEGSLYNCPLMQGEKFQQPNNTSPSKICFEQSERARKIFKITRPTVYLNSGSYIGPVEDIKSTMKQIKLLTKSISGQCMEDQALFSYIYMADTSPIALDYEGDLFAPLFLTIDNFELNNKTGYFQDNSGTTPTTPFVLHFNGEKGRLKEFMEIYFKTFIGKHGKSHALGLLEAGSIYLDFQQRKFTDLCNITEVFKF